jgi:hypothetical protein
MVGRKSATLAIATSMVTCALATGIDAAPCKNYIDSSSSHQGATVTPSFNTSSRALTNGTIRLAVFVQTPSNISIPWSTVPTETPTQSGTVNLPPLSATDNPCVGQGSGCIGDLTYYDGGQFWNLRTPY